MSKFKEAVAAYKPATVLTKEPETSLPEIDFSEYASLVPTLDPIGPLIAKENETIDGLISSLGIVGAYKAFIHKMTPRVGRKSESIMISCPLPWHVDKNPSAWMNSDKNTWFCGACQRGGDIYDLAAIGLGYNIETYKDESFVDLRRDIARNFGYETYEAPGVESIIYKEEEKPAVNGFHKEPESATSPESVDDEEVDSETLDLEAAIQEKIENEEDFTINWREIVKPDTFIWKYMEAATADQNVEEFHFWNSLLALGMAVGRNVYANDSPPVYSNLFICLLGGSSTGKTKSRRYLDKMLLKVLPYDDSLDYPSGAKEIVQPNSAEFLIRSFSKPVESLTAAGTITITDYASVRGIIRFEELASYKAIAGRQGSDLGTRMLEFYDCKDRVSTGSLASGTTISGQPFASAFTTTQPRQLAKVLSQSDEDSGFLNRWLFVGGKSKPGIFWGGVRPDMTAAEKELFKIHVWGNTQRIVEMSDEAAWQGNKDLNDFIGPDKDKHDPALGRIDLTIKKLCLLFAINEMTTVISLEIYERVMKLYNYIKGYSLFKSENLQAASQRSEVENAIIAKCKDFYEKNNEWPTTRDLARSLARKVDGSLELMRILDGMAKAGFLIADIRKPKIGRPTTHYIVID